MSFGFSVGDFLAAYELVSKIYKDFAGAPEQFQQISRELKCLENAIRPIEKLSSEYDLSSTQQESLADILENCNIILRDTQKTVNKYRESLDPEVVNTGQKTSRVQRRLRWIPDRIRRRTSAKHSTLDPGKIEIRKEVKRLWDRVQFEPDDIRDLRGRMTLSITYCDAFRDELRECQKQKQHIEEKKQAILTWLSPIKYAAQQSDLIRRRQAGTGQWLLDSPEYRHWVATKKETLFCPGIPGAGKTILTSIVVDNLLDLQCANKSIGVCYAFLNFRQRDEQKLENLMASLLKQLAKPQLGLSDNLKSLAEEHMSKETRPSVSELRQALSTTIASFSRVYIIVDALDECDTDNCQQEFISELLRFGSNFEANIFATSRFIPTITSRFGSAVTKEIRASEEDIIRYLDENVSRLPPFISRDISLQTEIKEKIVKGVDGIFLLAQLHLDSIKDTTTRKDVRVVLNKLAKGSDAYDKAYNDAMVRINGQLSRYQSLALRTLFWIACAKRPLTTIELRHALGVELGATRFDEDNLSDLDDMVTYCCGLVTIDEGSDIIRLVHYTTQEYLERTQKSWFPDAQYDIARTCITYLSFDAFRSGASPSTSKYKQRLSAHPLYKYASDHWGRHAYLASDYQDCTALCIAFLTEASKVQACAEALFNQNTSDDDQITGLHLAAFFGLYEAARSITEHEDPSPSDSHVETPMYYAIQQGHPRVVELLIENGDIVDSMVCGQPLLVWAASYGHEAIVRLLLDRGGTIDLGATSVIREGRTALSAAAEMGHEATVRLLLERGATIDLKGGWFVASPLHDAIQSGHGSIAQLLLDKGADIDSVDSFGRTALYVATEEGKVDMARLLLANDADADIEDYSHKSPLQNLIMLGYNTIDRTQKMEMMRLLLEDGYADPDCEDDYTYTPLWLAIKANDEELTRLLLEKKANTEVTACDYRTPLYLATEHNNHDLVRILLENGAIVDGKETCVEETPFMCAADKGYWGIARLLLQNGANINSENKYGNTIWSSLDSEKKEEMMRLLLECGINVKPKINSERRELPFDFPKWR